MIVAGNPKTVGTSLARRYVAPHSRTVVIADRFKGKRRYDFPIAWTFREVWMVRQIGDIAAANVVEQFPENSRRLGEA